ncbi:MAG: carbohydrate ABC transporter permease [Clostridia bacterium]|nr:carbohydrate ABC transporter permease [Clostridia bacterium]
MKLHLPPKGARKDYFKKMFFGSNEKRGIIMGVVVYVLLITIAFIYLYPVLYMFSRSLMSSKDLLDSSAKWIPSAITSQNYKDAIATLDFWNSLWKNIQIAVLPTIAQVFICSMVGYGFARYKFPGRTLWMGILILSFLLPSQTIDMPNYLLFQQLKMMDGSLKPFLLLAVLGQGFKSVLCILIFYNFHRQVPQSLIEAAEIDGADHIKAYFQIAIPLSMAAIVCVTLFSLVWYWNETYLVRTYLGYGHTRAEGLTTLMIELQKFEDSYNVTFDARASSVTSTNKLNDAIKMAGTMLSIAPLLLLYLVLQKQFVESVDRAGITGE